MESTRFAAWTRRRFGLLTGTLAASLLSATSLPEADAKKKKKKKKRRCRKVEQLCGGKRKCCKDLACDTIGSGGDPAVDTFCCKNAGHACPSGVQEECCRELLCTVTNDPENFPGKRCCGIASSPCGDDQPCCLGLVCLGATCVESM